MLFTISGKIAAAAADNASIPAQPVVRQSCLLGRNSRIRHVLVHSVLPKRAIAEAAGSCDE